MTRKDKVSQVHCFYNYHKIQMKIILLVEISRVIRIQEKNVGNYPYMNFYNQYQEYFFKSLRPSDAYMCQ